MTPISKVMRVATLGVVATITAAPRDAHAWLFHEHAVITAEGASALPQNAQATLQTLWSLARGGQSHLCARVDDAWHGDDRCVGFSALPSIAGDHSCSPEDLDRVARQGWALRVIAAAHRLSLRSTAESSVDDIDARLDMRREHDRELLFLDDDFMARAESNVSHFDLARLDDHLGAYLDAALAPHEQLNAQGLYAVFHGLALHEATRARECADLRADSGPTCNAGNAAWHAILAESYALHMLEDSFSAGHTVGAWGNKAQRAGTHDHYCQWGVDATLWGDDQSPSQGYAAHGDGFLSDPDLRHTTAAVRESLTQLVCAFDASDGECVPYRGALATLNLHPVTATVDTCAVATMPPGVTALTSAEVFPMIGRVLRLAPRPARRQPETPRFTNELGVFVGLSAQVQGNTMWPGDGAVPTPNAFTAGSLSVGINASGMLSRYADGMAFLSVGIVTGLSPDGARTGVRFHLRTPLAPWDVVGWALRSIFTRTRATTVFFASLAGGAVIPGMQQYHIISPDWAWQFALGREAWVTWFPGANEEVRWSVPVINVRGQNEYLGRLGTDVVFSFGFEGAHREGDFSAGCFISATPTGRYYLGVGL